MTSVYCLDANILINGWHFIHPPDLCPSFWDILERLANHGIIFICEDVYEEIQKQNDGLARWLKARKAAFMRPFTEEVGETMEEVYRDPNHRKLVSEASGRSAADPFVIAYAIVHGAKVVTHERMVTSEAKPRIPNVCRNLGVECITFIAMLRELGIQFNAYIEEAPSDIEDNHSDNESVELE